MGAIYIPDGAAGDEYTFGTWVHTVSAPLTNERGVYYTEDRTTGIRLEAFNGTDEDPVAEETVLANTACRDWQFISGTLTIDEAYTYIVVTVLHDYNIEESCYDGVQVFRERFGYSYEYDIIILDKISLSDIPERERSILQSATHIGFPQTQDYIVE